MVTAFIPHWNSYLSIEGKMENRELWLVGGKTLLEHSLTLVEECSSIHDCVLFSNDNELEKIASKFLKCKVMNRPEILDAQDIKIEAVIASFLETYPSCGDVVSLIHPKCPFIKLKTFENCIHSVVNSDFTSSSFGQFSNKPVWFDGTCVNKSKTEMTPHPSEIGQTITENSSTFVFHKHNFLRDYTRFSENHHFYPLSYFEGFEVERLSQLSIAELIFNSGLAKLDEKIGN